MEYGPYDGIIGFSQGSVIARLFWRIVSEFEPELKAKLEGKMPWFFFNVCGTYVKEITYKYKDIHMDFFNHYDFLFTMPSIHILGRTDMNFENMKSYRLFKDPVLIFKEGGH